MSHGRGQRREQVKHVKEKMRYLWKYIWRADSLCRLDKGPTDKWVGVMASTHGKPCSCAACCNVRRSPHCKSEHLTMQERRAEVESVEELRRQETRIQIEREVEAIQCSDPRCDCHGRTCLEDIEEEIYEMVTGETAKKLAVLHVTVTPSAD